MDCKILALNDKTLQRFIIAKVLPQPEVKDGGDTGNFDDPALTTIQESEENGKKLKLS